MTGSLEVLASQVHAEGSLQPDGTSDAQPQTGPPAPLDHLGGFPAAIGSIC